jgi:hypothetical protein
LHSVLSLHRPLRLAFTLTLAIVGALMIASSAAEAKSLYLCVKKQDPDEGLARYAFNNSDVQVFATCIP